ncbi:TetR/AcrR family transcriptional regulator [Actinoplanes sp. RD1]|uniref:TetR/AcrR family transcriptional regulator n=1 Tax=Actinoplanes sp. RD1 TaxID=3064538 RepID=UPI0027418FBF|nr:TetR/AcrR family transcriptional regulator [Actinoplanes sp. RD1]
MLYGAPTPLRRDARRNRESIVAAAGAVLTGPGPAGLMAAVARRAGVGQATLYRHFPDRYALTAAVIDHELAALAARAAAPVDFRHLLGDALHRQVAMRPLVQLAQRLDAPTRRRYEQRLLAALTTPLRTAQARGLIRTDLAPADVLLLFSMVRGVAAAEDADRSVELLLGGLLPADR